MNLSVGIVGLPNVGKSTLFNALLKKQQAFVANYPFATIEPNIGIVPVPDERLTKLAEIEKSEKIVPATVKFVDIAGLVKGAAEGQGLGNKFLAYVRECNAICQVIRYFSDPNVVQSSSTPVKQASSASSEASAPNPQSDFEVVNTELILADLQTLEISNLKSQISNIHFKTAKEKLQKELNAGILASSVQLSNEEREAVKELQLLTMKPMFTIANVDEDKLHEDYGSAVPINAKLEAELASLSEDEQKEYLSSLGLKESGLERIIKKGYEILDLISFLTAGEKEARAWTIKRGTTALKASGTIHTDFIKNFIKAEVISFGDFVASNGWRNARELGKTRFEGRDYIVKDEDVIEFKIGS